MNVEDSRRLNVLFKINSDLERMGDHVVNLSEHASQILKEKQKMTPEAHRELADLRLILDQTAALLPALRNIHRTETLQHIDQLEEQMDQYCEKSRQDQIKRLRSPTDRRLAVRRLQRSADRSGTNSRPLSQPRATALS